MKIGLTLVAPCLLAGLLSVPQSAKAQCTFPALMSYSAAGTITTTFGEAKRKSWTLKILTYTGTFSLDEGSQAIVDYNAAGVLNFVNKTVVDTTNLGGQLTRAYSHTFSFQLPSDCTVGSPGTIRLYSGLISVDFDFYVKSAVGGVIREIVLVATNPNNAAISGTATQLFQ